MVEASVQLQIQTLKRILKRLRRGADAKLAYVRHQESTEVEGWRPELDRQILMVAGTSARPRTFRQEVEEVEEEEEIESGDESEEEPEKRKGAGAVIEIDNPNLVKPKTLKARNVDLEKTTEF